MESIMVGLLIYSFWLAVYWRFAYAELWSNMSTERKDNMFRMPEGTSSPFSIQGLYDTKPAWSNYSKLERRKVKRIAAILDPEHAQQKAIHAQHYASPNKHR